MEMGFNHTFFFFLKKKVIYISGLLNVKAFSAPQKYEGAEIQRMLVSVPLSVAVWAFPTVCVRACACLRVCIVLR